jgi:hypothetical protein
MQRDSGRWRDYTRAEEESVGLYKAALGDESTPLEAKVLLHLALLRILGQEYECSLSQIIEMASGSDAAKWYVYYYSKLYA